MPAVHDKRILFLRYDDAARPPPCASPARPGEPRPRAALASRVRTRVQDVKRKHISWEGHASHEVSWAREWPEGFEV